VLFIEDMSSALGTSFVALLLLVTMPAGAQTRASSIAEPSGAQEALLKPFKGDWEQMKQRRMLRALVVYSRSLYFVDRGRQRGATYEVLKAFEDEINAQLKTKALRFHVFFIPVSRDQLIPALLDGRGDLAAANLTITPEREGLVDFSAPVRDDVSELVVTGPSGPRLSSVDDLAGQVVHVRRSSSYWDHLEALSERLVQAGKSPVKLVPVSEDLEDEDLLEMANAGLIPIVVCDGFKLDFWKQTFTRLSFEPEVALTGGTAIGWAMRRNSPQLKAVVDGFIKRHRKGTAFGNQLLRRYRKGARSVLPATAKRELRKFQQTVEIFRKYGSEYEIDYLLAMAQGYQESRLDQRMRSPVGALGVMQLMPATAEQMKVGDIRDLEANIHAGVKYLRHVEDTYFNEESLDPLVKALFAFASYNAGPNRIRSLRKEAAKRGLDPNRWFKNVEYVVADKIGQETVTYVSNIFKYYIAYQLVAQAEQERKDARERVESGKP
jgi:membrane-bound lytic murein transglycosylase MltF